MKAKRDLSVTSRRFHNITTEFLYESVHLSKGESYFALDMQLGVHPEYFRFIRRLAIWNLRMLENSSEDA